MNSNTNKQAKWNKISNPKKNTPLNIIVIMVVDFIANNWQQVDKRLVLLNVALCLELSNANKHQVNDWEHTKFSRHETNRNMRNWNNSDEIFTV